MADVPDEDRSDASRTFGRDQVDGSRGMDARAIWRENKLHPSDSPVRKALSSKQRSELLVKRPKGTTAYGVLNLLVRLDYTAPAEASIQGSYRERAARILTKWITVQSSSTKSGNKFDCEPFDWPQVNKVKGEEHSHTQHAPHIHYTIQ